MKVQIDLTPAIDVGCICILFVGKIIVTIAEAIQINVWIDCMFDRNVLGKLFDRVVNKIVCSIY